MQWWLYVVPRAGASWEHHGALRETAVRRSAPVSCIAPLLPKLSKRRENECGSTSREESAADRLPGIAKRVCAHVHSFFLSESRQKRYVEEVVVTLPRRPTAVEPAQRVSAGMRVCVQLEGIVAVRRFLLTGVEVCFFKREERGQRKTGMHTA